MTKIKLCGLSRPQDIETANQLRPAFVGFVFAPGSKRYVSSPQAEKLRGGLSPEIQAVGVFVDQEMSMVAQLLNRDVIQMAQLHGSEDDHYIRQLQALTGKPVLRAFRIASAQDLVAAERSAADHILLDSGAGTGRVFNWGLLQDFHRPYFLAGGLTPDNVARAVEHLHPYGVDTSSGIETQGAKDPAKMAAFVAAVRKEDVV